MRKQARNGPASRSKFERIHVFAALVAILVIGISAGKVLSRQFAAGKSLPTPTAATVVPDARTPVKTGKTLTVIQQDQEPAKKPEIQELTPEEEQQLAAGLKPMLNKSSEGLNQVEEADGSTSLNLQGRFRNVTVARVNKDGSVENSCVDNPGAAAVFFGISPQTMENAPKVKPKTTANSGTN